MSRRSELDALLDGAADEDTPLAELMSALQAPDEPEEFDGLSAAMTAFFTVGPAVHPAAFRPTPAPGRAARHRAAGRGLLLKLVTAFGGASLVGGVALAAYVTTGHHAPGHAPGPQPSVSFGPSFGVGGPIGSGDGTRDATPTKGGGTSGQPRSSSSSAPVGGGVVSGPTDITHPAHPTHASHSPGGKPTATPSASQTHPGNSGHTKHTSHPHPSPSHKGRPSS